MLDNVNNITNVKKIVKKINGELHDKILSIDEIIFKLSIDIGLRRDKLNKADAIIDDALNVIWNKIYRKNINRDKHKGIDKYSLSNRIEFLETMYSSINNKVSEIWDKIISINCKYITEKEDLDKLNLLNDEIKEFMVQLKQDLKKIFSFADLSKNKLNRVDEDKCVIKLRKEYIDLLDKINNKINNITNVKKIIKKINDELHDKIVSTYELIFKLSNDPRLRRDKLNKVDVI